jgi:hypothetical protein
LCKKLLEMMVACGGIKLVLQPVSYMSVFLEVGGMLKTP